MAEKNTKLKIVVRYAVTALVELFTGAVIKSVSSNVEGNRLAKFGASAGGILVGLTVGDKVADYVCERIDEFSDDIREIKATIEAEGESRNG